MRAKVFGEAGAQVVIEQFLRGEELSFFALTDGTSLLPLPVCQDHKAIYDGDEIRTPVVWELIGTAGCGAL
jgi:phosphoribosylamine--glycine ligase